jgi:uncharacterized protein YndB with AHSA1/START domain
MKHPTNPRRNGRPRPVAAPPDAIRVTRRFTASPQRVFEAWLDPEAAGRWLFATAVRPMTEVEIDARVGGAFRFAARDGGEVVEHTGRYLEVVPHRRLVFTLAMSDRPAAVTRVTVEIAPRRTGCELTLVHERVPRERVPHTEGRWTGMLYGLDATQATRSEDEEARPRRAEAGV